MKLMKVFAVLVVICIVAVSVLAAFQTKAIFRKRIADLKQERSELEQSAAFLQKQIQKKDAQIHRLSEKLQAAKNQPVLMNHKVKHGDSLSKIFGHKYKIIAKVNAIKDPNKVKETQNIVYQGHRTRVKKGQCFSRISKNWRHDAALNGIQIEQADRLIPGQNLVLAN